jgi:hypothetical protein
MLGESIPEVCPNPFPFGKVSAWVDKDVTPGKCAAIMCGARVLQGEPIGRGPADRAMRRARAIPSFSPSLC